MTKGTQIFKKKSISTVTVPVDTSINAVPVPNDTCLI